MGAATKLAFTVSPGNTTSNSPFVNQPQVAVQDAGGAQTAGTDPVTLSITTPAGAVLTCDANPTNAVAGLASFAGCRIDQPGTYTLTAASGALTSAVSSSFTIAAGTLTLSPSSVTLSDFKNGATGFTITATGFVPGDAAMVFGLQNGNLFEITPRDVTADATGTIVVHHAYDALSADIPALGALTISVGSRTYNPPDADLTIIADPTTPPAATPATPPAATPATPPAATPATPVKTKASFTG
ncbi:hypothetical protein [Demequina lutea]|uniref:hypothetical protein n=1 Tax=Demequina lutea TaxID=431489 RepID=UPI00187CE045|nr:hypothetical protein [Demequina lutea]